MCFLYLTEDDFVKRAAATPVIRRLLDKVMFSPFATLAALFDGINHFLLMISFRLGPAPALFHLAKDDDSFHSQQYLLANASLMASVVYFVTKTVQAGLAKHALSENLFWQDAFSFWNLLDTVPLLMVLLCSIAVDITLRQRTASDGGDSGDIPFFLRTCVAITTVSEYCWLMQMFLLVNQSHFSFDPLSCSLRSLFYGYASWPLLRFETSNLQHLFVSIILLPV